MEARDISKNVFVKNEFQVISVVSTKGGAGKTTIAVALSAFLANLNFKVLIIDADLQPSASDYYKPWVQCPDGNGIHEFVHGKRDCIDCVSKTEWGDLYFMRSNDEDLDVFMGRSNSNVLRLRDRIHNIRDEFDYIVIDTPGTRNKLTESAIVAADVIITPVEPTTTSAKEFKRGTLDLINDSKIHRYNDMPPVKFFINKKNTSNGSKELTEQIKNMSYDEIDLDISALETEISSYACYADSGTSRTPVHIEDERACLQIANLAKEVCPDIAITIDKFMAGE